MSEEFKKIIERLRTISDDIGRVKNTDKGVAWYDNENNADAATNGIQRAIEELQEIINRQG